MSISWPWSKPNQCRKFSPWKWKKHINIKTWFFYILLSFKSFFFPAQFCLCTWKMLLVTLRSHILMLLRICETLFLTCCYAHLLSLHGKLFIWFRNKHRQWTVDCFHYFDALAFFPTTRKLWSRISSHNESCWQLASILEYFDHLRGRKLYAIVKYLISL